MLKPVHGTALREAFASALGVEPAAGERAAAAPSFGDFQGSRAASGPLQAHVLLVEDEAVNAAVAEGYLEALGCTATWVASGAEAVAAAAAERFDLIFMDLEHARHGRLRDDGADPHAGEPHPAAVRTPIVALTAHDAVRYREKCLAADMDDILSKPYPLDACRDVLRRWARSAGGARRRTARGAGRSGSSSSTAPESLAAVDPKAVATLRQLGAGKQADLYAKLVELFRTSSTRSLADLKSALEQDDLPAAAAVCHKLASAAANVGALAYAEKVRELERLALAGEHDQRLSLGRCIVRRTSPFARRTTRTMPASDGMNEKNTKKRVAIIADDEDLGRLLLAEAVGAVGLEVMSFADGGAALEAALENDPAIVLLDVDMPVLDGNEVCRRLRLEPRFSSLPIVIVTGHQDSTAIRRAFDAGATDFISKPVNWALLPHRLEYILRNAAAAEHIERLAYYDTLTGLPNRRRCVDLLGRLVAAAKGSGEGVAVIYLDLNNFKRVNDTFGHGVGDDVLRTVAGRLTSTLSGFAAQYPSALVARFGGDEFVVAVRHAQAREVGLEIAAACSDAFAKPIVYDSLEFYSAPSVGMAVFPDDGADVATVLKHADTAMYQSKSGAADPIAVYAPAMSKHLEHWLELEAKLRRAIENDLLTLMFQPKFSLANNRLVGVEALVRWCDDEYGDIPPSRFVQIAEDSGLIIEMSAWVVRAACRQMRAVARSRRVDPRGHQLLRQGPAARRPRARDRNGGRGRGRTDFADRGRDHRDAARQRFVAWSRACCSASASSAATSRSTTSAPATRRSPTSRAFRRTASRSTRPSCATSIAPRATRPLRTRFCRWPRVLA